MDDLHKRDVIVVGAGAAGLTAALHLSKQGLQVCVLDGATHPGAENWSGCVFFGESLADDEILGPDWHKHTAIERKVSTRGVYMTNGLDTTGISFTDPETFKNCATVLRPVFDHDLSELARKQGAEILSRTTVLGLIRENNKVIGVSTEKGPLYADLVFLAEGDAAHLVSKEGYNNNSKENKGHYLQGIKEVIHLPTAEIDKRFNLKSDEGAAYEMIIRNARIDGQTVELNMGAFIYTNKESLSIGLVLPLENLAKNFHGDHNKLMEWFKSLPVIKKWLDGGERTAYGARIINANGFKNLSQFCDDGLAIGGACTGFGLDFPYPNFTGPASFTGLCLGRAVKAIKESGASFDRQSLEKHYVSAIKSSSYYNDMKTTSDWGSYIAKTKVFFSQFVDLSLNCQHPFFEGKGFFTAFRESCRAFFFHNSKGKLSQLTKDMIWQKNCSGASIGPFSIVKALFSSSPLPLPKKNTGEIRFEVYHGENDVTSKMTPLLKTLYNSAKPLLGTSFNIMYRNHGETLENRFDTLNHVIAKRGFLLSLTMLLAMPFILLLSSLNFIFDTFSGKKDILQSNFNKRLSAARDIQELSTFEVSEPIENKLANIVYETEKESHIKVHWPANTPLPESDPKASLWHLCPAGVYLAEKDPAGLLRPVINYENCIKCESCWRGSPLVDWGRRDNHRFIYKVKTTASATLFRHQREPAKLIEHRILADYNQPLKLNSQITLQLQEVANDLDQMHAMIHSSNRTLNANERQWLQQLKVNAENKVNDIIKSISDGRPQTLISELKNSLNKISTHLLDERFFWADAEIQTAKQHSLRQLGCGHKPYYSPCSKKHSQVKTTKGITNELVNHFTLAHLHKIKEDGLKKADLAILQNLLKNSDSDNEVDFIHSLAKIDLSLTALYLHNRIAQKIKPGKATLLVCNDLVVNNDGSLSGSIPFALSALAQSWLLVGPEGCWELPLSGEGIQFTEIGTIGLRSAAPHAIILNRATGEKLSDNGLKQLVEDHAELFSQAVIAAGDYLVEKCINHGTSRIQFPDLFQDEHGRDGIIKFGAVKSLISHIICRNEALKAAVKSHIPKTMLYVQAGKWLGTQEGSFTYNASQVFGGTGFSEDDTLSPYYRDASIFKYLLGDPYQLQNQQTTYTFTENIPKISPLLHESEYWITKALDADNKIDPKHHKLLFRAETDWQFIQSLTQQFNKSQAAGQNVFLLKEITQLLSRIYWSSALSRYGNSLAADRRISCGQKILENNWDHLETAREFNYEDFLKETSAKPTGTFLFNPDFDQPRYSPENLHADTGLAKIRDDLNKAFKEEFIDKDFEGLSYIRYAEEKHAQSDEVLNMFHDQGYMKVIIPKELGGGGRHKSEYYLLISASMRYGDPALSLIIQASTSIGTSPMLLAWKKDLPKASDNIKELLDSSQQVQTWKQLCVKVIDALPKPANKDLNTLFTDVVKEVKNLSRKNTVFKSQCGTFLQKLSKARKAGLKLQLESMGRELKAAVHELEQLPQRLKNFDHEYSRRRIGVGFFLSMIASGQTSAFALTEPSAGSDTARVATRANLKEVQLKSHLDAWGFDIGDQQKILIDLNQTRLNENTLEIRLSENDEWSPVKYDKYKWEDDSGYRYFIRNGKEFIFHEFGTVLKSDQQYTYKYYELTGSKMWITNGRFAGLFALYAKTSAGVTGFCVDRYVEGLTIGKDEGKMGQNASPTNEIFLEKVRVCTSFILGLEGRGQVNALETLNVGRAGLALSSLALSQDVLQAAAEFSQGKEQDFELLGQMAEEVIGAFPSTYEMVSLFDQHGSDARMESAIGKFINSEILHRTILYSEGIHGAFSQTFQHDVEKKKRDARIINIYEGTNEIQRFLILKDLIEQKNDDKAVQNNSQCPHIQTWEKYRSLFLTIVKKVKKDIGSKAWMDSQLQPIFFPLAETAAWLKYTDGAIWRYNDLRDEKDNIISQTLSGSIAKGFQEIDKCLQIFDSLYGALQQGKRPPEVTITNLVLDQLAEQNSELALEHHDSLASGDALAFFIIKPLNQPEPLIEDSQLKELTAVLTNGSEQLFRVIKGLPEKVNRRIVIAAPECAEDLILHLTSYADVTWLHTGNHWPTTDDCSRLWKNHLSPQSTMLFSGLSPDELASANYVLTKNDLEGTQIQELCWNNNALKILSANRSQISLPNQSLILNATFRENHLKTTYHNGSINRIDVHTPKPINAHYPAVPEVHANIEVTTPDQVAEYLKEQLNFEKSANNYHFEKAHNVNKNRCLVGSLKDGELSIDTVLALKTLMANNEELTLILAGTLNWNESQLNSAEVLPATIILADFPELWQQDCRICATALSPLCSQATELYFSSSKAAEAGIIAAELGLNLRTNINALNHQQDTKEISQECFEGTIVNQLEETEKFIGIFTANPTTTSSLVSASNIEVERYTPIELDSRLAVIKSLLEESAQQLNIDSITEAQFIIDIGYGIGNQDNFDAYIQPLLDTLKELSVKVSLGASRKLVETLKILPPETQIGQSGSSVAPTLLIAIGISGAPQHINYISGNTVVLSFNIDPMAPLMILNESKPFPKVHPLVGDLRKTIPALNQALKNHKVPQAL